MTESNYQNWLKKDEEWIGAYCSRIRKNSILKVVPLTLLGSAIVFGGVSALNGGSAGDAVMGAVAGMVLGGIICALYLVILLIQLSPGQYVGKIVQSVRELPADEREREFLGKEMLDALENGEKVLPYRMVGPNSKETPARVILTPHYILQEGSSPYAVLVRLSDIAEIKTGAERKMSATYGSSKTYHHFTLYTIGFYRRDRFDSGLSQNNPPDYAMGFFQEELRDTVVKLMKDGGLRVTEGEE